MNWHSFENKRILGVVPVEEDGSVHFEVPSDRFVYFQLLDQDGKMIQSMRSGTIIQSGEVQACVGCHESRDDIMITVGVFSLFGKEFTLPIIAALLTIIGYSLNDTIVVYDRIRENVRRTPKDKLSDVINTSINQTLSRTILTSGTTLLVVLCLFVLGGEVIHDFSFALLVGVIVGTYSSIYIASPILLVGGRGDKAARTSSRQG